MRVVKGGSLSSFFNGGHAAVAKFAHSDSHHSVRMQQSEVQGGVRDEHAGEALVSMVNSTLSTSFLADTGASHHICHDTSYFSKLSSLSGPFQVHHVDGSGDVTHSGQLILEVNSDSGTQLLVLENVLYMPSMLYNIISLQRLRATNFVYIFNEIPGKAVIKNARGGMVALMIESTSGRLTLDCKILSTPTPLPSNRHVEVFSNSLSMDLLHRRVGRGPSDDSCGGTWQQGWVRSLVPSARATRAS